MTETSKILTEENVNGPIQDVEIDPKTGRLTLQAKMGRLVRAGLGFYVIGGDRMGQELLFPVAIVNEGEEAVGDVADPDIRRKIVNKIEELTDLRYTRRFF